MSLLFYSFISLLNDHLNTSVGTVSILFFFVMIPHELGRHFTLPSEHGGGMARQVILPFEKRKRYFASWLVTRSHRYLKAPSTSLLGNYFRYQRNRKPV